MSRRRVSLYELVKELSLMDSEYAKVITSVSLKPRLHVVLKALAQKSNTSVSELVNLILETFIDNCEDSCDVLNKILQRAGVNVDTEEK
jgi:hypothetical protein